MNLTALVITMLSISFQRPAPLPEMCADVDCNLLYTATTVRMTACECNENTHTFVYPAGNLHVDVNYNMTYPIAHDFYQNQTLIDSCPAGLFCAQRVYLNPTQELTTVIKDIDTDRDTTTEKTVLFSDANYELLFTPV